MTNVSFHEYRTEIHMTHKINLDGAKKIHFIGIGGISMSGLAEILLADGYIVSGSDDKDSAICTRLREVGITVSIPNAADNIPLDVDLVVYTTAVRPDNPEFICAEKRGLKLIIRGALLAKILQAYDYPVCIAGVHGKTTTTSMVAELAIACGFDPTVSVGGHIGDGFNYRTGDSPYFILEACEYHNSFLHWQPRIGVILNIDAEHLDFYGGMDGLVDSFARFAQNIRADGHLLVNAAIPDFKRVVVGLSCTVITFGEREEADAFAFGEKDGANATTFGEQNEAVAATFGKRNETDEQASSVARFWPANITYDSQGRPNFDVMDEDICLARVSLPLPGKHNMLNALAAFATALIMGMSPEDIAKGLQTIRGAKRRFEYKGVYGDIPIIDDYAHHPTEVKACLAAARLGHRGRIVCLFQPHTYSRTKNLFREFSQAFFDADLVLLAPIFPAREPFDPSISSVMLADAIRGNGGNALSVGSLEEAANVLQEQLVSGDMLITMGAGEAYLVGEELVYSSNERFSCHGGTESSSAPPSP